MVQCSLCRSSADLIRMDISPLCNQSRLAWPAQSTAQTGDHKSNQFGNLSSNVYTQRTGSGTPQRMKPVRRTLRTHRGSTSNPSRCSNCFPSRFFPRRFPHSSSTNRIRNSVRSQRGPYGPSRSVSYVPLRNVALPGGCRDGRCANSSCPGPDACSPCLEWA